MSKSAPVQRDPLIGQLFAGRFQIEAVVGRGGMGSVYRARQMPVGRPVALKILAADVPRDSDMSRRFVREMKLTAKIEHPNTVQVFDFGQSDDGHLFLAMELLEGKTLTRLLAGAAVPPARIITIGSQIAAALAAAHSENIVHRDLKPDNIIVLDRYEKKDWVKVLDFGIARFYGSEEEASALTATGVLMGTPKFMSPEQASPGAVLDHRSDLYSLGAVLYSMAAGKVPFAGKSAFEILEQHLDTKPEPLSRVAPGRVPAELEALILKLLEKKPAHRPQTAKEVCDQLLAIEVPADVQAPAAGLDTASAPTQKQPGLPSGRSRLIALGAGVVALAGIAAALLLR